MGKHYWKSISINKLKNNIDLPEESSQKVSCNTYTYHIKLNIDL